MAVRLFVGNLPFSVTEAELREHFSAAGPVAGVWLAMDRETGRPRGFAFVEYDDRAHAEDAIRRFNNQPLGGRNLAVNEARPQERSGGSGGYRPGTSSYSARPPRPEGGGGGGGFDRPRPPAGPRPGFGAEAPPAEDFGRGTRDRSRNFGPDAPAARRKRKNDKKGPERGPKKPLQVTSQNRFYGGEGDDDLDDLSDLDAMFAADDADLEGDEDADSDGDEDGVEAGDEDGVEAGDEDEVGDGDESTAEERKTDE